MGDGLLFTDFEGKPQSIVCTQVMSVMKECNIRRHYEMTLKVKYGSVIGEAPTHVQKSCVQASYEVRAIMAKTQMSFRSDEIIKQYAIKMAKSFGDDKLAKKFRNCVTFPPNRFEKDCRNKQTTRCTTFDEQFSIKEELLDLVSIRTSAKGSDIYSALVLVIDKWGRIFQMFVHRKNAVDVPVLHCIIHQEVLYGKFFKMNDVMKNVTRIVVTELKVTRKLVEFLKELSAEFHDTLLHSKIRWLIARKTLTSFFAIRKEITEFLETAGKIGYEYLEKLQNEEWLYTLSFLKDITEHLNILNLQLQDLKSDLKFFKSCSEVKNEFNSADFKQHGQYVIELREEFEKLFSDFYNMKTIFQLFADPMAVTIEDRDTELQMEITYICECAFSTMKILNSKQRNRSSQEALKSNFRIVTTDIVALVNEHTAQCSHR
ncbi:hypothetical protein PR048_017008 [Dryococelus australis]|uniref:Uncharacterized protein n=1 Tax=Dryococelus australis TaxID=614101 RepID=A0ABQ9H8W6_9NEOP|nr:hypothetical protein PR048_017008 [Dryococelus australis]